MLGRVDRPLDEVDRLRSRGVREIAQIFFETRPQQSQCPVDHSKTSK